MKPKNLQTGYMINLILIIAAIINLQKLVIHLGKISILNIISKKRFVKTDFFVSPLK